MKIPADNEHPPSPYKEASPFGLHKIAWNANDLHWQARFQIKNHRNIQKKAWHVINFQSAQPQAKQIQNTSAHHFINLDLRHVHRSSKKHVWAFSLQ